MFDSLFRKSNVNTGEIGLVSEIQLPPSSNLSWLSVQLKIYHCKCTCNSLDKDYFVEVVSWRLHLSYNCTPLDAIMSEINHAINEWN